MYIQYITNPVLALKDRGDVQCILNPSNTRLYVVMYTWMKKTVAQLHKTHCSSFRTAHVNIFTDRALWIAVSPWWSCCGIIRTGHNKWGKWVSMCKKCTYESGLMRMWNKPTSQVQQKTQEKHLKAIFSITIVVAYKPMNYGRLQVVLIAQSVPPLWSLTIYILPS